MNMHVNHQQTATCTLSYIQGLEASLGDKTFFLGRLPEDVLFFAEFGCAGGSLLWETMKHTFAQPGGHYATFVGHDTNAAMALEFLSNPKMDAAVFASTFADLDREFRIARRQGKRTCLILSSVLHAVISQGTSLVRFWQDVVRELDPDYVVFREMAVSADEYIRGTDPLAVASLRDAMPTLTSAFENRWGSLDVTANLIHFLLKVRHPADWEMEMQEDYLPLSAECWLNSLTIGSGYGLAHLEHSHIPALRQEWKDDYGLDIKCPTHIKVVLKRSR